ncbi:MAG: hypothetical protein HP495_02500 [Nitrospira sp.]|nr:hypothetical protein [Nitrospira sp.]
MAYNLLLPDTTPPRRRDPGRRLELGCDLVDGIRFDNVSRFDIIEILDAQPTADRSYGIHVAKLAGLPPEVVQRAQAVLSQLERPEASAHVSATVPSQSTSPAPPQPHPLIEEMKQIDLFSITPLDALNRLAELQRMAKIDTSEPSSSQ